MCNSARLWYDWKWTRVVGRRIKWTGQPNALWHYDSNNSVANFRKMVSSLLILWSVGCGSVIERYVDMEHVTVPKLEPRDPPVLSVSSVSLEQLPRVLSFLLLLPLSHPAAPPECQIQTTIILCLQTVFSRLLVLHQFVPFIPSSVVTSM